MVALVQAFTSHLALWHVAVASAAFRSMPCIAPNFSILMMMLLQIEFLLIIAMARCEPVTDIF